MEAAEEWARLKKDLASLKLSKAEQAEQLDWALSDRDEALARVTSLEAELAKARKQVREGRSSLARMQVQKEEQEDDNRRLRGSLAAS